MEILISGILGIIIWQSVTLFAFAASDENEPTENPDEE